MIFLAQAAGLKYYQDLQQRIPRAEVAAIEFVVREAVLDLLSLKGSADASTLFCHAVGRYEAYDLVPSPEPHACGTRHVPRS